MSFGLRRSWPVAHNVQVHTQDASTGRVEEVLSALQGAALAAGSYTNVDVAVAYASDAGVALLDRQLGATPAWRGAAKRFLVSIDFGITDPAALARLAELPNSAVRVPNGNVVVASPVLRPQNVFHPKAYLFRAGGWSSPSALVIGSANLTVSALATGSEVVVMQTWSGTRGASQRHLDAARTFLAWFEDVWATAVPVAQLIAAYRARYRALPAPRGAPQERTPTARRYRAQAVGDEVVGALVLQLSNAEALWIRTDTLYHNLGAGRPGNQLDMPRGTRVFFGFEAARVSRNTIFGYVEIHTSGHGPVIKSVRFGNNEMDKVNLPVPTIEGPSSYDDAYLIFERMGLSAGGLQQFELTVTDGQGLARRKRAASHHVNLSMTSGREYGLLF